MPKGKGYYEVGKDETEKRGRPMSDADTRRMKKMKGKKGKKGSNPFKKMMNK